MIRALATLLLASIGLSAGAQFFTNYSQQDGLSNESVHFLLKEPNGYLWVATQEGLNRFDGEHFRSYGYDPADSTSIPHDYVEQMDRGSDGRIWITSFNGGLTMYDPQGDRFWTWEQYTRTLDPNAGRPTRAVLCHTKDSIYVGVADVGLYLYLPEQARVEPVDIGATGRAAVPGKIQHRLGHE